MRPPSLRAGPRQAEALRRLTRQHKVLAGLKLVAEGHPFRLDMDAPPVGRGFTGRVPEGAKEKLTADPAWGVLYLLDRADVLQAQAVGCRAAAQRARELLEQDGGAE